MRSSYGPSLARPRSQQYVLGLGAGRLQYMDTNRLMSAQVVTGCTIFGSVLRNTREWCTDFSLPVAESGTF